MPNFTGFWTPTQQLQARSLSIWPATPEAPTSVVATAGVSSVSVAFTAPADAGIPATITSFTATSSPGGFTASGASSPLTVVGLTIGTAYTFTVTATNTTGTGPASSASNSATPVSPSYVEDVFATALHAGNSSTQTITNNIDLSTNSGLVWIKARNGSGLTRNNRLWTTNLTGSKVLQSDTDAAIYDYGSTQVTFNGTGFALSSDAGINATNSNYVSWTFRKKAKFFDIVTYTGTGASNPVAHSLASTPGWVIIKATSTTGNWFTMHRANGTYVNGALDSIAGLSASGATATNAITSTTVNVQTFATALGESTNSSGVSYVMYLFAHDAGGFGSASTDNVISCGSYTGDGNALGPNVPLGWEPQWLLIKRSSSSGAEWVIYDNIRGLPVGTGDAVLYASDDYAEYTTGADVNPTATGFQLTGGNGTSNLSGATYIYVAIRRPMKPPTVGTSVYSSVSRIGTGVDPTVVNVGFAPDTLLSSLRTGNYSYSFCDRLRGVKNSYFAPSQMGIEYPDSTFGSVAVKSMTDTGVIFGTDNGVARWNYNHGTPFIQHFFRRAPGFYDQVCYTGTGTSSATQAHNLGVVPELIILKSRVTAYLWYVFSAAATGSQCLMLQSNSAYVNYGNPARTSTTFTVTATTESNDSAGTYVAYLFATLAGVSKVGSYTGTAATKQIDCGFTSGARFVLIKRTDSPGDWYVFDTTRGIISGNDPYLLLNSTVGEEGGYDLIDPYSAGFELNTGATAINASGGTYIFLAIA